MQAMKPERPHWTASSISLPTPFSSRSAKGSSCRDHGLGVRRQELDWKLTGLPVRALISSWMASFGKIVVSERTAHATLW